MVATDHTSSVSTVGQIARRFKVDREQVRYVIRTRKFPPIGRAGNYRLFAEETVLSIGEELAAIALRREALGQ